MPDENGLDLLPRIKKQRPELPIVVMSAQNTLLTAIKAAERGAYEYLPKPFDLKELLSVVGRALTEPAPSQPEDVLAGDGEDAIPLIGRSTAMQEIYRLMARLMATDLTVMISGESGTGKELVARALHDYGKRRQGPFVAINMAAIPRELIESELFGHEKGAFTGANTRYAGRFEQAEGGTLFLDEIGDMPLEAQTRLLRVLQQGEYTTVGGRTPYRTDVRIIAATNRDLRQLVHQGLFREDLFYPPERGADPHPAAQGTGGGCARSGSALSGGGAGGRTARQDHWRVGHGPAAPLPLARQRSRAGEPRATLGRAICRGNHRQGRNRARNRRGGAETQHGRRRWRRQYRRVRRTALKALLLGP